MGAPVLRPGTTLSLGALLGQRCPPLSALPSRPWTLTPRPSVPPVDLTPRPSAPPVDPHPAPRRH